MAFEEGTTLGSFTDADAAGVIERAVRLVVVLAVVGGNGGA